MPTYQISNQPKFIRQAGDDCDIKVTIPALFPLSSDCVVRFGVVESVTTPKVIFIKTNLNNTLFVDGQAITIPLLACETINKYGDFQWELDVTIGNVKTTIGRGVLVLIKKLIK